MLDISRWELQQLHWHPVLWSSYPWSEDPAKKLSSFTGYRAGMDYL